ncbi:MAG: hypothetical protein AAGC78_13170 [Cellvibrio sp.]|uniref:hypothetical protein n=1 Tax=Cellvibrio sp. TaxID=1965322 RepID=UPI0031A9A2B0
MHENLNEFSRNVSIQFFKSFPELKEFATALEENDEGTFSVKVIPPFNVVEHPLSIDTFGEEVTVAFDAYHAHFNEFKEECEYGGALTFIKNIVSEQYAVVSFWRNDQWCGSSLIESCNFPSNNENYPYANLIKIRSWSGKLNKTIECIPRD